MAFNFGNTSGSTFGNAQNRPTAFGAPFGGMPTTSASTGFSGFGSTFGAPVQTQATPGFGNTFGTPATAASTFGSTFGTPAVNTASAFGSSFGTSTPAPAFGSTFGAPAASAAPGFGSSFGNPSTTSAASSLFGSTSTTKPSLFGTPSTSTPSLFQSSGTGLFGTTTTTQAPGLFGTATSTVTPSLFGAAPITSTPSLFGNSFGMTSSTSTPSLFGTSVGTGLNTSGTGFNLFGNTTTTSAPSLFTGFGNTATTGSGFGGFGNTSGGFGGTAGTLGNYGVPASNLFGGTMFGAKPTSAVVPDVKAQQVASFYGINVFGDERDEILKKWNLLQACWGTGKGYFSGSHPPVIYNQCNPFYRFKAIGYIVIPQAENADGFVKLIFNKKESDLRGQQEALINGIAGILGNKPNLSVSIKSIKATNDNETEVTIFVTEKGVTGVSRKIHATDLSSFLNHLTQKQQLANVGVSYIGPYMVPNKAQLEDYLKYPPPGIDQQMWIAAQADNPQPNKYLPTVTNGFADLKKRLLYQEHETGLHRSFLVKVNQDISELKKKHASSIAQISDLKQKFLQLQHRVLRILVKQEVTRKVGLGLQPEEEVLKGRLEMMQVQLNAPSQYRAQINELVNNMKVSTHLKISAPADYKMDPTVQDEVKQFLSMEQNGITHLVKIINADLEALRIISEGMNQFIMK